MHPALRASQRGNVLFMILIAVGLFAALSYAVTSSSRSGSGDISNDKLELAFGEIKNVVIAHRQAVQRMIMAGIPVQNISAYKAGGPGPNAYNGNNTNCPHAGTNHACKLYHPQGGGLSYYDFTKRYPELTTTPYDQDSNTISFGSWGDSINSYQSGGTAERDLLYSVKINKNFCDFINDKMKVDYTGAGFGWATQSALGFIYGLGGGSPGADTAGIGGQSHARHLYGKDMGCWWTNRGGGSYYFTALIYLR